VQLFDNQLSKMAPEVGLEPTTHRLTADCSTIELLWNAKGRGEYQTTCSLVKPVLQLLSVQDAGRNSRAVAQDFIPRIADYHSEGVWAALQKLKIGRPVGWKSAR
jgi:hypothetical protein